MKQVKWGMSGKEVSAVALGCMRLEKHSVKEAAAYLEEAVGLGINFMEHADIYGGGRCESLFAEALAQTDISRDQLWIQSKCAIVPGQRYDFSKEYWFNNFLKGVFDTREFGAQFNREISPEYGDRVLILSTCLNEDSTKRFLVLAVCEEDLK